MFPTPPAPSTPGAQPAIDRSSPLPLWAQVLADLTARLSTGEFAERFPTDQELVETYGVSRQTVREAVRRLADDGVLARERGRGTRVRALEFEHTPGTLEGLFHQVEAQGATQTSVVRVREQTTDAEIARTLELPAGAKLVHIERLRLADGEPLALDRSWLPARVAGRLLDAPLTRAGLYDELARLCGVTIAGGSERVRPVVPTPEERRALGLPAGVAGFAIERLVRSETEPVEWRQSLVRGDRYSFVVELSPRRARQPPLPWAYESPS
ncbi:MAG TPA: GntR family transcriptional regulator [Solirubrobacteraceae bacterium]|jgi:GntR family transcriptional regulator|nr:GntR family transcriptional regulator [Solirubrobacteraceae bacterium]